MSPRAEGIESEVVRRLTVGIEPPEVREILVRCLGGEMPAADALLALLEATESPAAVRQAVDEVTRRTDEDSRADDRMVRDRVDDLTQLVIDIENGADRVADRVRAAARTPQARVSLGLSALGGEALGGEALWLLPDEEQEEAVRALLDALVAWGTVRDDARVLELGCGSGRVLTALAGRVREAHGLERDAELSAAARRRTADLPNVFVEEGSDESTGAPAGGYDVVLAVDYFAMLASDGERERALAEAARALRPAGRMVVVNFTTAADPSADAARLDALAVRLGLRAERLGELPVATWRASVHQLAAPESWGSGADVAPATVASAPLA